MKRDLVKKRILFCHLSKTLSLPLHFLSRVFSFLAAEIPLSPPFSSLTLTSSTCSFFYCWSLLTVVRAKTTSSTTTILHTRHTYKRKKHAHKQTCSLNNDRPSTMECCSDALSSDATFIFSPFQYPVKYPLKIPFQWEISLPLNWKFFTLFFINRYSTWRA